VAAAFICLALTLSANAFGNVAPAGIRVADETVWVGQRATFFVELRAPGSFVGAAGFTLPEIPRTVIVKVGSPVVSSEEIEGESYFVQTHRFALFSQASGKLEIPSFNVRFGHRSGFTGPARQVEATVPSASLEVKRPPGSDELGFVITTDSFQVTQSWNPEPGEAKQGAVFKRVIEQKAEGITGMALFPPPSRALDGVKVYPGKPEVTDSVDRGDFRGQRRDTLTYVFQRPGVVTIPAIRYVWWNPRSSSFDAATVPAATFEINAAPVDAGEATTDQSANLWPWWLIAGVITATVIGWRRDVIKTRGQNIWRAWQRPDRVAARQLIRACRRNNAADAERAWNRWRVTQPFTLVMEPQLRTELVELHRHKYQTSEMTWRGENLERAFRRHLDRRDLSKRRADRDPLPPLNLTGDRQSVGGQTRSMM